VVNWAIYRVLILPLVRRAKSQGHLEVDSILATFGISFIFIGILLAVFGGDYLSYSYLAEGYVIFGQPYGLNRIAAFLGSAALCIGLYVWLHRTRAGLALRAVAVNPAAAGLVSINVAQASAFAFALGGAVTAATAAVIMETIPATGGYLVPPPGYFTEMRRICDEHGTLLILDEVQAGLGRTGRLWALEHFDVVPDILVIGKGLSAAVYPIAACCFGPRVEAHFAEDPFFHPSSYAGSELGARVVEALVARYEEPGLLEHVEEMGARLRAGFEKLVERYPDRLAGHRGLGLMVALETHSEAQGLELTKQCFAHGLLAIFAFNRQSTLQVMPPLVITASEVDEVLERLEAAVAAMEV